MWNNKKSSFDCERMNVCCINQNDFQNQFCNVKWKISLKLKEEEDDDDYDGS